MYARVHGYDFTIKQSLSVQYVCDVDAVGRNEVEKYRATQGQSPAARSRKGNTVNTIGRHGGLASSLRRKLNIVNSNLVRSRLRLAGSMASETFHEVDFILQPFAATHFRMGP